MGFFSKSNKSEKVPQRWTQEGQQFKNQLNGFLDAIYKGGEGPEEPQESRGDMAQAIYGIALEMNREGKNKEFRTQFPPTFEPFQEYYDGISRSINQVMVLKNGDIVSRADGNIYLDDGTVNLLQDDKITEQEGIMAFGTSIDKSYIVKVTNAQIQVHTDWNEAPIWTSKYPNGYGPAAANVPATDFTEEGLIVLTAEVFNDGKRVLPVTTNGVFIISESSDECLFPTQKMIPHYIEGYDEEYEESVPFEITLSYCHAKLSPDNTKIAAGIQDSQHYIFEAEGDSFKSTGTIQARSEYPHTVCFHDNLDHVALASCHYQRSGIVGMDLKHLPIDANTSWYNEEFDERFDAMNDNMWVFSIVPYEDGYLVGANNGYIWHINPKSPEKKSYIHLGGTIMCMDYSADKKYLVVGTFSGFVTKIDMTATERDKTLVSDMNVKETNRWFIWREASFIW